MYNSITKSIGSENLLNLFFIATKKYLTLSSSLLLSLLCITIFIIPLFPSGSHSLFFSINYTIIFILSALAVRYVQKRIALFALIGISAEWISRILNMPLLSKVALPVIFILFMMIVGALIMQIAKAENVNLLVLLDSICGYLLLGICFSLIIALLESINPGSFNFQDSISSTDSSGVYRIDFMYFAFVTLTSTGYGDFLPLTPGAKSLSNLISVSGQLYMAIIIAMLVGKYLNKSAKNSSV